MFNKHIVIIFFTRIDVLANRYDFLLFTLGNFVYEREQEFERYI